MCQRCLSTLSLFVFSIGFFAQPVAAQSGCALQINEVMYHPGPGSTGTAVAEWVELYVAQNISTDTTFFITDLDGGILNQFNKAFTIPSGTASGSYIVVNNDGDPANDGQTDTTGIYTTISYFIGNGAVELNNDGDEIALYIGADNSGTPCDIVVYEAGNSPIPAGFNWNNGCALSNSNAVGVSISIDPDGTASNSSCDWAASGEHSSNNPDLPITGAPHSKGWSNNTTPTAVSLSSFAVQNGNSLNLLSLGGFAGLVLVTFWRKPRSNK